MPKENNNYNFALIAIVAIVAIIAIIVLVMSSRESTPAYALPTVQQATQIEQTNLVGGAVSCSSLLNHVKYDCKVRFGDFETTFEYIQWAFGGPDPCEQAAKTFAASCLNFLI